MLIIVCPFNCFFLESTEERITMHKALKQNNSIFSRYYLNEDFNEIKFDFELVDDIIVGENFRFELFYFILLLHYFVRSPKMYRLMGF